MEANTITSPEDEKANRKQIERSAAYPSITIEDAISLVAKIYEAYSPKTPVTREDVAALVEDKGYVNRNVAAAAQYNLLTRESGKYKISTLFIEIHKNLSEKERIDGIKKAFASPKLYQELIGKFDNHALPRELQTILLRQHDITEKAAPLAAEIFIQNAKYAGVLNEQGILRTSGFTNDQKNERVVEYVPKENNEETHSSETIPEREIITHSPILLQLNEGDTIEELVIHLTEKKKAILKYPSNFTSKDITILKQQIDVLALLLD